MKLLPTFRSGALVLRGFDQARDAERLLAWRNDPRIREKMFRQSIISPEEHAGFISRYESSDHEFWFVAEDNEGPVGSASISVSDPANKSGEFGRLMVGPERALGHAYGAQITLGLVHFAFKKLGLEKLRLSVKPGNHSAFRCYVAAGFRYTGKNNDHGAEIHVLARPEQRSWEKWDEDNVTDTIVDHCWANTTEVEHRDRLAKLIVAPGWGDRVVEVGAGSGELTKALVRQGMPLDAYTGVDTSYRMLARALAALPRGDFRYGDVFDLEWGTKNVATVVCTEVLGHLPDWRVAIAELARIASRRLVVSLWLSPAPREGTEEIAGAQFLYRSYSRQEVVAEARRYGSLVREVDLGLTTALVIER
jgi:RimJ/RimL family protein N-acetyltransferase